MKTMIVMIGALLLMSGCGSQGVAPSVHATAAQNQLDQISAIAMKAAGSLAQAQQSLERQEIVPAQAALKQAAGSVKAIRLHVDAARIETRGLADDRDSLERHKDDLSKYKANHADDWLGPRAHRWIVWICVLGGLLCLGYLLLTAAGAMGGGVMAGAANVAGHLCTFGLKFVGQAIGKLMAWALAAVAWLGGKIAGGLSKAAP